MTTPARNGPCSCGSGKKYKRCCGRGHSTQQATGASVAEPIAIARSALRLKDPARARRAIAPLLDPKKSVDASVWSLATQIEMADRRFSDAVRYAEQAALLEPGNLRHRYNLGTVLTLADERERALEVLADVVARRPDLHQARVNLANTQRDLGFMEEARENYLHVLQLADSPDVDLDLLNHVLVTSHLFDLESDDFHYSLHCKIGDRLLAAAPPAATLRPDTADPAPRRLRIGYLSPRFSREIVGFFFRPLIDNHDRERVEVFLYSATRRRDDLTDYFRQHADHWREVTDLSDSELQRKIEADRIDVLVDLAGHAPENRLRAIAAKPASLMVSMLDYFDTTGLPTMDYLVTDHVSTPAATTQRFREQLLRMSQPRLVYAPPDEAPAVAKRTQSDAPLTFGSFNRVHKINEQVVALWARLMGAVRDSRLILKGSAYSDRGVRDAMLRRFASHGVEAERLELRGASPHGEMLDEYNDIDIALDTFPYNGGLTTLEALWMGTPVLTLIGGRIISRQSAAFLTAAGLPDWVARSGGDFVAAGVHWSADRAALSELQRTLRDRINNSSLVDGASFTRELEDHFFSAIAALRA